MALVNKVGSLIRQTASKQMIHNEFSASNSSILQIIRCMSSSQLIVQGLSPSTTNTILKNAFAPYGHVKGAVVSVGGKNARSRFGFVLYSDTRSASAAKKALDQKELHGRVVRVNYFPDKPEKDRDESGVGYGSSLLEGFTWNFFDRIFSGKKIQDSDVAGHNVGASDKRNDGRESHNSGVTSGNKNANEDYGDLSSGYYDGESHNSDSLGGDGNASEDYGHGSSGYFDGEIQNSDPAGENNDSFFSGWGGGGDDSKGFFSGFFSDDD